MKYCKNCGARLEDEVKTCPECGMRQDQVVASVPNDNGGFGWGLLGFCIPLVGLVLFLIWKDEKPKTSKAAGLGALISVIISVAFYILAVIIGVGSAMLL